MDRRTFIKLGSGAAVGGMLSACGGGNGNVPQAAPAPNSLRRRTVVAWNDTALHAIRAQRPSAPMAARSLAIAHTAMYDAWAAYDPIALGTRYRATLRRPASEHTAQNKAVAISFAAYAALVDQFPAQRAMFDARMAALGLNPALATHDAARPEGIGTIAAASVVADCHHDGANQLGDLSPSGVPYADYTGYAPRNPAMLVMASTPRSAILDPGRWQPLTFRNASGALVTPGFAAACWPRVAPFALRAASQFRPGAPAAFGSAEYADQARYLLDLQLALTEQQKVITEYWAGGATGELPASYWCQFAQFVSERDGYGDDEDVKLFFALANANFDAGIAAWDAKVFYDSARPITALRYLMSGKQISGYGPEGPSGRLQTIDGSAWMPYQAATLPTPPFADHVSGHSTFSAASAEVLSLFTGSDKFGHAVKLAAGAMLYEPGLPSEEVTLQWATFSAAAAEAGISRLYGGIHFANADTAGRTLGRKVGAHVVERARRHWTGSA